MIRLAALILALLVGRILTLSWGGALVLVLVVLFALWCVEPFGNRAEWRIAAANWRERWR